MDVNKQLGIDQVETLKKDLSAKVEGLMFMSETDSPLEIVTFNDSKDIKPKLIADSTANGSELTELNFKDFWEKYGVEKDWQDSTQKDFAHKFGDALKLMQKQLQNVSIFRVGGVRANLYILGQTSSTAWLGFKTLIVET